MFGLTTVKKAEAKAFLMYKQGLQEGLSNRYNVEDILRNVGIQLDKLLQDFDNEFVERKKSIDGAISYLNMSIKRARTAAEDAIGYEKTATAELIENNWSLMSAGIERELAKFTDYTDDLIKMKIELVEYVTEAHDTFIKMVEQAEKKLLVAVAEARNEIVYRQDDANEHIEDLLENLKISIKNTKDNLDKRLNSISVDARNLMVGVKSSIDMDLASIEEGVSTDLAIIKSKVDSIDPKAALDDKIVPTIKEFEKLLHEHIEDAVTKGMEVSSDEALLALKNLKVEEIIKARFKDAVKTFSDNMVALSDDFKAKMLELTEEIKERHKKAADEGVYQASEETLKKAVDQMLSILDVRSLYQLAKEKEREAERR